MKENNHLEKYIKLKADGKTPTEVFVQAKKDGYKNFECINLLMVVYDMNLDEARNISHSLYYK